MRAASGLNAKEKNMPDSEVLTGCVMEETWLTLEQVAGVCTVSPDWLSERLNDGLFPQAESVAGVWRFSDAAIVRARRMWQLERDFDAVPELAALMADVLEEMDDLRAQLRRAGLA
jgi:chaperone modulatory protein CbpM